MKKKRLIMFLVLSIVLYFFAIYLYKIKMEGSFLILVIASFLIAISSSLFKKNNKQKNNVEFKIEKVKIKKKNDE